MITKGFGRGLSKHVSRLSPWSGGFGTCATRHIRRRACASILQRDSLPRIIDDIPRRLPNINFPSLEQDIAIGVKEFFLPSNWGDQELPWRVLFVATILIAITAELVSASTKTAQKLASQRERRRKKGADPLAKDDLGAEMPDIPRTPRSQERLKEDRSIYKQEIRAERSRGLGWLAAITLVAIWCTGILFKDNALQP